MYISNKNWCCKCDLYSSKYGTIIVGEENEQHKQKQ